MEEVEGVPPCQESGPGAGSKAHAVVGHHDDEGAVEEVVRAPRRPAGKASPPMAGGAAGGGDSPSQVGSRRAQHMHHAVRTAILPPTRSCVERNQVKLRLDR